MRLLALIASIVAGSAPPTSATAHAPGPPELDAPPQRIATSCDVKIAGGTQAALASLRLIVGGREVPLGSSRTITIEVGDDPVSVEVSNKRFVGRAELTAADCQGEAPVIELRPRPATLRLLGVPTRAVVRCLKGCGDEIESRNYLVDAFPPIPIGDAYEATIALRLRHPDYFPLDRTVVLFPGVNEFTLLMQPRCP